MIKINLKPITLRDTLILKYEVVCNYSKVLKHTDLPYEFDQVEKVWWRWYCDLFGFYYSRIHRNYSIWLTSGLKKKIGLYMPFLMRMPDKRSMTIDPWKRRTFLYKNSYNYIKLNNWINPKDVYSLKFNFFNFNYFKLTSSSAYAVQPRNHIHRPYGSFGIFGLENEMFFSGYNGKWHSLYNHHAAFHKENKPFGLNFLIAVNSFFMSSGFFVNSFDSEITIYPQYYLQYYNNNLKNQQKIKDYFWCFKLKFNNIFFKNIIFLLFKIYLSLSIYKFKKLTNIFFSEPLNFKIYKLNLLLFFILFYNLKNNNFFSYYFYFKKFKFLNFLLLKKTKNNIKDVYLKNFLNDKEKWLNLKKKKYKYIYDYFIKLFNKIDLYNQKLLNNLIKSFYFKKYFIKFNYKKYFEVNKINYDTARYIKYEKKEQMSLYLSKLVNSKHEKDFPKYINNKNFFCNIIRDMRKIFNYNIFQYKYHNFIKYSLTKKKNQIKLKAKWYTNYGKIFVKVPDFYRNFYGKASVMLYEKKVVNSFLFAKYNKKYHNKLREFTYNFFNIILDLFKYNFGFFHNLISFSKEILDINHMDLDFFFNLKIFIYKYFKLFNFSLWKKYLYKNNSLFNNKFSYNKLFKYIYKFKLKNIRKNNNYKKRNWLYYDIIKTYNLNEKRIRKFLIY